MTQRAVWHVHHNILLEFVPNIEVWRRHIQGYKPRKGADLWLQLLKPVAGQLPPRLDAAGKAYKDAWRAYRETLKANKEAGMAYLDTWNIHRGVQKASEREKKAYIDTWDAYKESQKALEKAREAYEEALDASKEEINLLHAKECPDCPWNGTSIFPT